MILAEEHQPTPAPAVARHTVEDAALALIEFKRVQGVSASYLGTLSTARRLHFGPELGSMALRQVHRRDVDAMSARLLSRGLAPKTVANTLKILHGVFEHAIDLERTTDNPVRRAARPKHIRDTDGTCASLPSRSCVPSCARSPTTSSCVTPSPFAPGVAARRRRLLGMCSSRSCG